MIRKFLVQFEYPPETRWLVNPGQDLRALQHAAELVAVCHTAGPEPAVTVTQEETKAEV